MSGKRHITLEQGTDPHSTSSAPAYLVIETRNTIKFRIGELLTAKEVDDLKHSGVDYTVKALKAR